MKKIKYFLIAAILTVISFCFSPLTASADDDIRPQKLAISGTQKTVYTGSTFKVSAKYSPSNADDDHLYWAIVGTKGIVQFSYIKNESEFVSLLACSSPGVRLDLLLGEAIISSARVTNGMLLRGRTPSGINYELRMHNGGRIIRPDTGEPADMGSTMPNQIGYDSNAFSYESGSLTSMIFTNFPGFGLSHLYH